MSLFSGYQLVVQVAHGAGRQHGALHGAALEHAFDPAADPADPKRLATLRRVPEPGY